MKKTILSGIQSSGHLTLGNYLGALKNFKILQDSGEYTCQYFIADLHSITVRQDPKELRERSLEIMTLYLALGLGGGEHNIFFQSHVHEHAELAWVLGCYTQFGELERMTQFKDKVRQGYKGYFDVYEKEHKAAVAVGLFTYPVLMAADILLYQADLVPTGADQKQHLELTRNIAIRFNNIYGETFKVPEPYIPEAGARIMSLQDPTSKMSKSDPNPKGYILLLDEPDVIMKKVKSAVTDSIGTVEYDETNPDRAGMNNLINIYSVITSQNKNQIQNEFANKGYRDFKTAVGEAIIEELRPLQQKFKELSKNPDIVREIYTKSAHNAHEIAKVTLADVYNKIGFVLK